jgi:hypothetical protein
MSGDQQYPSPAQVQGHMDLARRARAEWLRMCLSAAIVRVTGLRTLSKGRPRVPLLRTRTGAPPAVQGRVELEVS